MKIATWNVNSIKVRRDSVVRWLREAEPDVACLQEIKCAEDAFPHAAFEDLGYNLAVHGQKTYNGVAILSKFPMEDVTSGLPGDNSDEQARYLEAVISREGGVVRVASLYLPNGNPSDGPKYEYKLHWMARLRARAEELLGYEEPVVLAGDYNVIPTEDDVHDPDAWRDDALFLPQTRAAFREIFNLGFTEAFRASTDEPARYTFWDYQGGAWPKNHGIRIDHLLLSPQAADRLTACDIDKSPRGWQKPSDHVPVWAQLAV
jgi:exodeoxyribonuclease III